MSVRHGAEGSTTGADSLVGRTLSWKSPDKKCYPSTSSDTASHAAGVGIAVLSPARTRLAGRMRNSRKGRRDRDRDRDRDTDRDEQQPGEASGWWTPGKAHGDTRLVDVWRKAPLGCSLRAGSAGKGRSRWKERARHNDQRGQERPRLDSLAVTSPVSGLPSLAAGSLFSHTCLSSFLTLTTACEPEIQTTVLILGLVNDCVALRQACCTHYRR